MFTTILYITEKSTSSDNKIISVSERILQQVEIFKYSDYVAINVGGATAFKFDDYELCYRANNHLVMMKLCGDYRILCDEYDADNTYERSCRY